MEEIVPSQVSLFSSAQHNWTLLQEYKTKWELDHFLRSNEFKCNQMHGWQSSKCSAHPNSDHHNHSFAYFKCESTKCVQQPGDICPFMYRANECHKELNVDETDTKRIRLYTFTLPVAC